MALYYFDLKIISRTNSATTITAKAAYRAGEKIYDPTIDQTFDYTRKRNIFGSEILLPDGAPDWAHNRSQLWVAVEQKEDQSTRRNTAQLAREIVLAMPVELNDEQRQNVTRAFVRSQFVAKGMIADVAYHDFQSHNPHAHVLLTMREVTPEGFGKKNRSWNNRALIKQWREQWAEYLNAALERAGHEARVDHRSLQAQGIDLEPQIHLGPQVIEMERNGIQTEVGDTYRAIAAENRRREAAKTPQQTINVSTAQIVQEAFSDKTLWTEDERHLIENWHWYKANERERIKPQDTSQIWQEAQSWGIPKTVLETLRTAAGEGAVSERDRRLELALHAVHTPPNKSDSCLSTYQRLLGRHLNRQGRGAYRRSDIWLTWRLAQRGYSKAQLRRVLAQASPELMDEQPGQRLFHIRRIVDLIFQKQVQQLKQEQQLKQKSRKPSETPQRFGKYSTFEVRHELGKDYEPRLRPSFSEANRDFIPEQRNHRETSLADLDADLVAALKQAARTTALSRHKLQVAHRTRANSDYEHSTYWQSRGGYYGTAKREYLLELSRMATRHGDEAVLTPETDQQLAVKLRWAGYSHNTINKAILENSPVAAALPSRDHQAVYLERLIQPSLRATGVREAKETLRREMTAQGRGHEMRLKELGLATEVPRDRSQELER